MTQEQLTKIQAQLHKMVDGLFSAGGLTRLAIEEGMLPVIRITFQAGDGADDRYTLVVGIEEPDEDEQEDEE